MATTTSGPGIAMIALSQIRHDRNVRQQLAASEVEALAHRSRCWGSSPRSSSADGEDGFVLVAGHKRYAAMRSSATRDPRGGPSRRGGGGVRARSGEHRPLSAEPV